MDIIIAGTGKTGKTLACQLIAEGHDLTLIDTNQKQLEATVEQQDVMAVRGNCDAEVDQMMLKFPIMSDYAELAVDNQRFFLTHGHLWNSENLPALLPGTIMVHGHTHIPEDRIIEDFEIRIFNPGSISLPKQQTPRSFGFFDGKKLIHCNLE